MPPRRFPEPKPDASATEIDSGQPPPPRYTGPMKWTTIAAALGQPLKACFDLTLAERRLLLGVLVLFCIGLAAREVHRRNIRPAPYTPPLEHPAP